MGAEPRIAKLRASLFLVFYLSSQNMLTNAEAWSGAHTHHHPQAGLASRKFLAETSVRMSAVNLPPAAKANVLHAR